LFDIESNDDGTWRRIRKCDFVSKFVDEGEQHTDETEYIFPKDKSLKDKLPKLAPVFASLLVKRAFETGGIVEDCTTVMNASNKYRKGQDHISAFLIDRIIRTGVKEDKIKKTELYGEFKIWFEQAQGSRKVPKGAELYEYMNKMFKDCVFSDGWRKVKIRYPSKDDEDEGDYEDGEDPLSCV
jgi:phage/plasmid-associated DNA primase